MDRRPAYDGVVDAAVYKNGVRTQDIDMREIGKLASTEGAVVWIGLHEPSSALLRLIQKQFNLHDLAVEDALKAHQRPKVEVYGETLFIVARTAQLVNEEVLFGETHVFLGKGFVVTVRHGPSSSYAPVRKRCEANKKGLANGEDFILYALLDFIVDNYMPVNAGSKIRAFVGTVG